MDYRIGAANNSSMDFDSIFKRRRSQDLMGGDIFSPPDIAPGGLWFCNHANAVVDKAAPPLVGPAPMPPHMHSYGTGRLYKLAGPSKATALLHGFYC